MPRTTTRSKHFALLVLFAGHSAACAATATHTPSVATGSPSAAPSLLSLPSPDQPRTRWTERMRFGYALAEEAFELRAPAPPSDAAGSHLVEWTNGPFRDWLARKSHAVEAARRELDVAAEEDHRQRIMAGAIVGLMYEEVARVLRELPEPRELANEPEFLGIFREVVESQASPFLEHARRAFHACAANASGGPNSMSHWESYCSRRLERLPEPAATIRTASR